MVARAGLKKIYSKNEIYIFYFFKDTFKETIYNAAPKKENLYVKEAYINEGRSLKRMKAGSKGRVNPILKRSSHITIVVSEKN